MKKLINFIALISLYTSTSCALMFHGSSDTITIRSNDDNVKIYVNEAYVGKNSAITTVSKKDNAVIRVSKKGCTDKSVPIDKKIDPTTFLGILIDFGIITILIVDGLATGAWKQAKQTSFVIDPECQ